MDIYIFEMNPCVMVQVTFLQVTRRMRTCQEAIAINAREVPPHQDKYPEHKDDHSVEGKALFICFLMIIVPGFCTPQSVYCTVCLQLK